jgi:hypothetical protein
LNAIDEQLDESGGELTPEIEAELEKLEGAFDHKVDAVCVLRRNALAYADACQVEVERLDARATMFRRKAESLRHFLHNAFIQTGKDKVKTAKFTVYRQSNPASVRWTKPLEDLPLEFRRVKVEPNIKLAGDLVKEGQPVPDGFEVVQGEHLRIV